MARSCSRRWDAPLGCNVRAGSGDDGLGAGSITRWIMGRPREKGRRGQQERRPPYGRTSPRSCGGDRDSGDRGLLVIGAPTWGKTGFAQRCGRRGGRVALTFCRSDGRIGAGSSEKPEPSSPRGVRRWGETVTRRVWARSPPGRVSADLAFRHTVAPRQRRRHQRVKHPGVASASKPRRHGRAQRT